MGNFYQRQCHSLLYQVMYIACPLASYLIPPPPLFLDCGPAWSQVVMSDVGKGSLADLEDRKLEATRKMRHVMWRLFQSRLGEVYYQCWFDGLELVSSYRGLYINYDYSSISFHKYAMFIFLPMIMNENLYFNACTFLFSYFYKPKHNFSTKINQLFVVLPAFIKQRSLLLFSNLK